MNHYAKKDGVKSTSKGRGLTPKQEKFCQLYIELGNASEAYRQAYDCSKMSDESIKVNASKLLNDNTNITLTIDRLRAKHQHRHNLTVDDLLSELEEARQVGKKKNNAVAMVSATMGKAKILGLDKQVINHTSSDGSMRLLPTLKELFANE
ncbi:terminase small subunit [Pasteurella multocida]|uniref:terminase small subunit n=1 Tax=Pasteurella multocida TaxID=747 RepID=UPI000BBD3197|nr:terminase small subunit [Pasteurella multocida]ATF73983.1 terminase small subunit [Pasteurella multocida]ATN16384.1 terminase small subunit [Pasteurella multocida]MCL7818142.1 terminase small subunit [Pasteurella multocida]MDY0577870.1 terminase small subunit [Pasteurella multocida]MEB3458065.1 terminase small subunit [Pasteurella multocida]